MMNCETCSGKTGPTPVIRRLVWREQAFCDGRCAAVFDQRIVHEFPFVPAVA